MIAHTMLFLLAAFFLSRVINLVLEISRELPEKPEGMRQDVYEEYIASRARHGLIR